MSKYRREINKLVKWCWNNDLALKFSKIKGLIIDFRKGRLRDNAPIFIAWTAAERNNSFKFWECTSLVIYPGPSTLMQSQSSDNTKLLLKRFEEIQHVTECSYQTSKSGEYAN